MSYTIVGLGNPGKEYEHTRHNTGRIALDYFANAHDFSPWQNDRKTQALISTGVIKKEKTLLLKPETFMNKSGASVKPLITSAKKAETLVVVHDDLDLPLGAFKIVFGRGSGGHCGVESIIRAIKTKDFVRIRIGIAPTTPSGKIKKPKGEKAIIDFIIGTFKLKELETIKKTSKLISQAIEALIIEGRATAMNRFN
ncbi:MAG: aminoacyl-tRNA hydrolase [Candidatus Niyogibacteria bacterium]|nr:aminoacyl-tRNA hydrolase [Candidatus Niyogibacteria bacterium]